MSHPSFSGWIPSRGWMVAITLCVMVMSGGCQRFANRRFWFQGQEAVSAPIPAEPSYRTFASPLFQADRPRRIVILESGPTPGTYGESKRLITELASQIRFAGAFEVVVPSDDRLFVRSDNILTGEFDEREIATVARRYNADAIALVRVNDLRSYVPMRISATMAIVDSNEAVVVFGIDGTWDTSRAGTQNEFFEFAKKTRQWKPEEEGPASDIYLQSPTLLMSFTASQMTEALARR